MRKEFDKKIEKELEEIMAYAIPTEDTPDFAGILQHTAYVNHEDKPDRMEI